ncbi:50S ribosomal protein L7/L12 [Patescibacteria group bacterium]|nr:50S ribosomal protein L7/L12 [Patescibacteria group bacterium]MBU1868356.1 50S ribosomal protein L7/L12 [Patescibacteria group bacterium]
MTESKKEGKVETTEEQATQVSKELQKIIDAISKLNVLQLSELVGALEDKFGVTANTPTLAAIPAADANGQEAANEEKDSFKIILKSDGGKKIPVIKALREIRADLGLKEAKDLVDNLPSVIEEEAIKEKAEEIKKKLEAAGAEVSLE